MANKTLKLTAARSAWHPADGPIRMFTARQEQFQFTAHAVAGTWPQARKHTMAWRRTTKGRKGDPEYRFADGNPNRLPDLAAELVRLRVDVIAAGARQR